MTKSAQNNKAFTRTRTNPPAGGLNGNGFTLIEMVVTIAIISILALVLLLILDPLSQQKKAKDAKVRQNVRLILGAAHQARADVPTFTGVKYPTDFSTYFYKSIAPEHPCETGSTSYSVNISDILIKSCSYLCTKDPSGASINFCLTL